MVNPILFLTPSLEYFLLILCITVNDLLELIWIITSGIRVPSSTPMEIIFFMFKFVALILVPSLVEGGDCELYERDYNFIYEEPTCSTSSHFTYKDDDDFYVSTYDEFMRLIYS